MDPKNSQLMVQAAPGAQYRNLALAEIKELAGAMVQAKMFPDIESANTAYIKILAGQEMGVSPFQAMSGIHIIKGRAQLAANLMATKVMESGRYRYRVIVLDENICHIDFQALEAGKWVKIGESRFTYDDAKRAGTQNIDRFRRNMLFARALSNGVKWYCPDVFGGAPVYVEGEIIEGQLADEMTEDEIKDAQDAELKAAEERLNRRKKAAAAGQRVKGTPEPEVAEIAPNEPQDAPVSKEADATEPEQTPAETTDVLPTAEDVENLDMDTAMDAVEVEPVDGAAAFDKAMETGEVPVDPITPAQRRRMYAIMGELGIKTEADKKAVFKGLTGLESSNDLSKDEAMDLISQLESADGGDIRAKYLEGADGAN